MSRNRGRAKGKSKINKDGLPKNRYKVRQHKPARGFGTFISG